MRPRRDRAALDGLEAAFGAVAATSLAELESATGTAVTGGGTLLPMSDVIRLAANAHHYLTLYDRPTQIQLYRGRTSRLATAGQRLVL